MLKKAITVGLASAVAIGFVGHSAAEAGTLRVNPALCPDLREDIRDSRITWGPRDLREDRRDRRVTNCPAAAYSYRPTAVVGVVHAPVRGVYVAPAARYHPVHYRRGTRITVVRY